MKMGVLILWRPSLVSLLILNFLMFHVNSLSTSLQLSCQEYERSVLLQFKHSFVIDKSTCQYEDDYPKASSWDDSEGGSGNCCLWDGVKCDKETGHVIGLDLSGGCIYGSIHSNSTLFHLVHLRKLNLAYNNFNLSSIPTSICQLSEMTDLDISCSFFSGQVPHEISRLSKLSSLDLSSSYFPEGLSVENNLKLKSPILRSLVQNLTRLEILRLNYVDVPLKIPDFLANISSLRDLSLDSTGLYGSIPSSLSKLTQLTRISLPVNRLCGYIPSSLQNLTQLIHFNIDSNQISGPIPSWLGNLTRLYTVSLSQNALHGSIPESLYKLHNLEDLFLTDNNLEGIVEFDMFLKMRHLADLGLAANKLSVIFGARNMNATSLPQFSSLLLGGCNLTEFPDFLRHQNELLLLDLASNSLRGQIPKWIWNSSVETLQSMDFSDNFLTGFHHPPTILPWRNLIELDLHSNMLQGQLPIPPSSTEYFDVSNNMISGEIFPLICNLSSVMILDLSNNNFSGTLPHCLGNSSRSLLALNLRNNSFQGIIWPLQLEKGSNLRMIDFSRNQFRGKLPRSLEACMMLEFLDFSSNHLVDVFPAWLGTLPGLKVLFLQKNGFHGAIRRHKNTSVFPNLHIINLSYNSFTGELPSEYIFMWNGNKVYWISGLPYMNVWVNIADTAFFYYNYSTTMMTKSVETYYGKIREDLAVIDLSCNKFSGMIPEFNGNLVALHSLNLSNNMLTGRIPLSVGNLSQLESLDLSRNMLSGEIPPQLAQLNFLQSFSVAHNNLTGPIPQGNQLRTFDPSSFQGNPGLCGDPLPKKCGDSEALPLPPSADEEDDDSWSPIKLDWKFVLAGAISGFVIGVALGDMVTTRRRQGWFLKAFGRISRRIEITQLRN